MLVRTARFTNKSIQSVFGDTSTMKLSTTLYRVKTFEEKLSLAANNEEMESRPAQIE